MILNMQKFMLAEILYSKKRRSEISIASTKKKTKIDNCRVHISRRWGRRGKPRKGIEIDTKKATQSQDMGTH